MTPAQILSRAADILEARGWCQGRMRASYTGACCTYGAILLVTERDPDMMRRFRAVKLAEEYLEEEYGITRWNDDPSRTLPQVLAMLRGQDWRNA